MAGVIITGGTGLVGTALTHALLKEGYAVTVLTRNIQKHPARIKGVQYATWNPQSGEIDTTIFSTADYIVNLAGANIAEKRWTKKRKREILESRVQSAQLLVKALKEIPNHIKAVISASAIGWYGIDKNTSIAFKESDPPANDFFGTTCKEWEAAIAPVAELGKRLVIFRNGIVLSNEGGAYPKLKQSFKFKVAAILGSGKQIISWVHVQDLVNMYLLALRDERLRGVYNAVAPSPVSYKGLLTTIGAQKNIRYICLPVPEFMLKLALGEVSGEVLKSTTVSSEKIRSAGFQFLYPTIKAAIQQLEA